MANLFESTAFDHLDNIERDIDHDTDTDLFGFETIWKNNHNTKPIEWTELVDNPMIVGELVGISTGMVIDGIDFYFKQKKYALDDYRGDYRDQPDPDNSFLLPQDTKLTDEGSPQAPRGVSPPSPPPTVDMGRRGGYPPLFRNTQTGLLTGWIFGSISDYCLSDKGICGGIIAGTIWRVTS